MSTLVEETEKVDRKIAMEMEKRCSLIRDSELSEEEDLRKFEGLRADGRTVYPDIVESVRRPRPELSEGDSLQREQNLSLEEIIRAALMGKYDNQNSAPLCIVPPSDSVKSDSPDLHLQRTPSEPLRETDSTASIVSVKSESSMFVLPCFHLQRGQSELLRETDSRASNISMKSASSMIDPLNFNLKRKQSQLTEEISRCSLCEEAVKDPVRLLCGHWSCKQCVLSHWDQSGSTADYPCKTCGRRFKGEPEHQTDTEDDKKNLNLHSASQPAPQNTCGPAGREKTDQDLQSVLLEKTIKRVEMETEKLQAEKEKLQAEKEKLQAEKETFQAEKEKFQAEKEKSQSEKEKFELEKRKLALEIQSLEQKGSYNPYTNSYSIQRTLKLP